MSTVSLIKYTVFGYSDKIFRLSKTNFCLNARLSFKFSVFYIARTTVNLPYFSRLFPELFLVCSISKLSFITSVPCFVVFAGVLKMIAWGRGVSTIFCQRGQGLALTLCPSGREFSHSKCPQDFSRGIVRFGID